jgi:site-specific DNA-cytosine methylase
MKNLKALSFFSGAMGLDLGLKKAGIEIILFFKRLSMISLFGGFN